MQPAVASDSERYHVSQIVTLPIKTTLQKRFVAGDEGAVRARYRISGALITRAFAATARAMAKKWRYGQPS